MKASQAAIFLAVFATTNAWAQMPVPCEKLDKGAYRIFSELGSETDPKSATPVRVRKGAIIAQQHRPLVATWMKPEGDLGALVPYKSAQLLFGSYRIDGQVEYCAQGRREDVFGAGDTRQHFLLRCLVDADSDGIYESFHRRIELVPIDRIVDPAVTPSDLPRDWPLVQPFRLVAAPGALPPNAAFEPRLRSIVQIKDLREDKVTLRIQSQVRAVPGDDGDSFGAWGDEDTVNVPLQNGLDMTVHGIQITIARRGRDWMIAAPAGMRSQGELVCGGTMLDTGTAIAIFEAGGMALVRKAPPTPRD